MGSKAARSARFIRLTSLYPHYTTAGARTAALQTEQLSGLPSTILGHLTTRGQSGHRLDCSLQGPSPDALPPLMTLEALGS
jgi:hypothetical protein